MRPKSTQLCTKTITSDVNSVSLVPIREKSSEKDNLDLNKECFESNLIADNDIAIQIKTENEVLEDDYGVNPFSEAADTLSDDDVSTKVLI